MTTLIEEAESLLLYQFKNSSTINALITGLVKPFQEALQHVQELHNGRYINEAHGSTLDIIGDILNFSRNGLNDDDYRQWLKVAILLNNSSGTGDNILGILKVLFGEKPKVQIDEYPPNVVMITFFAYPHVPIKVLFSIIRKAVPITTKCTFVDASSGPKPTERRLAIHNNFPVFQLDVTGFDEAIFADYFEEVSYDKK